PQSFDIDNPNWKLTFTPGPALTGSIWSMPLLIIAALLALGGALLGLHLTRNKLLDRLGADVRQLGQLVHELSSGKPVKAFSLRLAALDGLAQSLARMSRRRPEPAADAAKSLRPEKPLDLVDPLFQHTDILDIDILDEDQDLLGL